MELVNHLNDPKGENELAILMLKIMKEEQATDYMSHLQQMADNFRHEYKPEKVAKQYYQLFIKVQDE